MATEKVLIVDDELSISELLRDYLEREGYKTRIALDGERALAEMRSFQPQLMILDIMLPAIDGHEVCRLVRSESDIPILMLSARHDDLDKILSLGLGADDYVTKPFSPSEVVARVRAHLRRYGGLQTGLHAKGSRIVYGQLVIDLGSHTVRMDETPVELSAKEFELLAFLARRPGQVFTRDQLFDYVWGENRFGEIKTVTVHIQRLREKLGEDSNSPRHIKTVWGVGYRFDA